MPKAPPRTKLDELFLEIQLTSKKHLIVEGQTDERFLLAWRQDLGSAASVVVTPVENLHVTVSDVEAIGMSDGNRSRVVYVAKQAAEAGADLRCVADRDCGHHVDTHTYSTLLWTDYPSLESYAVDVATLDKANLLSFEGRLPSGAQLINQLKPALRDLFAVRTAHEHLERPNYAAGFTKKGELSSFNVALTIHPSLRPAVSSYERCSSTDPRDYAYGHDIGELLLAAFGNDLKNKAGLGTLAAVEAALRSAMQAVGAYRQEALFCQLEAWIVD